MKSVSASMAIRGAEITSFLGRLRSELQEAQEGFDKAQARISAVREKLAALRQQAREAGVELSELK